MITIQQQNTEQMAITNVLFLRNTITMRLSLGAALLALAPTVLGWKITLYDQEDCNDHGDNFSYVSSLNNLTEKKQY
jgi:hypothetical protein